MLSVFLAVTMLASPPQSPDCYQGVIGDGARQRRLIVQVQSETTAIAHLYTRPVRELSFVADTAVAEMRVFRSADTTLAFTLTDDQARVTTRVGGTEFQWPLQRVGRPDMLSAQEEWSTTIGPGGVLRLIVRLRQGPCGTVVGEFDSPDQGQNKLPMTAARVATDSIEVEASYMDLRVAFPRAGAEERQGTLTQGGLTMPIVLKRGDQTLVRPQEPRRPFPYDEREVAFASRAPGVRIAGTLALPRTSGPHPAIVLISGSGAQDRDETIAGHRPFLVLSDHLTRAGYAVLRTDDRGAGGTSGQVLSSDIGDLADDVRGALDYLRSTDGIDTGRIGLLGHSEGGYVAPVAAAADSGVAFLILLAAPSVSGRELILSQRAAMSRATGLDTLHARLDVAMLATILESLAVRSIDDSVEATVEQALSQWISGLPPSERTIVDGMLERRTAAADSQSVQLWRSRWFHGLLNHDPARYLSQFDGPVFALIGDLDIQVTRAGNEERFQQLFQGTRRRFLSLYTPAGVNHMLQPAETGRLEEYATIETTIATTVLDSLTAWLRQHVPTRPK